MKYDYEEVLKAMDAEISRLKDLKKTNPKFAKKIEIEDLQKAGILDKDGNLVLKKGKPVADVTLRDTENIPLTENVVEYFNREILPYAEDAWIDEKKTKVGYEIPMMKYFYEYQATEPVETIVERINALETEISESLNRLFRQEV